MNGEVLVIAIRRLQKVDKRFLVRTRFATAHFLWFNVPHLYRWQAQGMPQFEWIRAAIAKANK